MQEENTLAKASFTMPELDILLDWYQPGQDTANKEAAVLNMLRQLGMY